ncbi:hypothetical protein, partial [uncultured Phenylobacterium sp.]|uniref:hypothetical protein n=1 Tax=uncultured Phenylobacterium sp. TaxID=349273 RepID=UPI0025D09B51
MSACARGFASISDKSTRINAAFYAYWMLPDVSATDLALGATGRPHPAKLLKLGGSVVGDFKCDRCGDGLEVRSRNHMGDLMRGQPWAEGYRLLCPWCAQEVSEERSRAHDAERKAQDARTAELQAL